jgi:hypothetical protein
LLNPEFEITLSHLLNSFTEGYVNTIKLDASLFNGEVFSSNPSDCPLTEYELIHSPAYDEQGQLVSYVLNDYA